MGKESRLPALRHLSRRESARLSVGAAGRAGPGEPSPRPLGQDFRPLKRRVPGSPTQLWAPVKTTLPVAGAMEAPMEAEVENEDGDSSCGDLCFMDKGLRR